MNAQTNDRIELSRVIDAVCDDLKSLKARMHNSSVNTIEAQVESFQAFEDYARDIVGFTDDLRVKAVTIAASLGNQELSNSEIADLRNHEAMDDIFADCKSWADEVMAELEGA